MLSAGPAAAQTNPVHEYCSQQVGPTLMQTYYDAFGATAVGTCPAQDRRSLDHLKGEWSKFPRRDFCLSATGSSGVLYLFPEGADAIAKCYGSPTYLEVTRQVWMAQAYPAGDPYPGAGALPGGGGTPTAPVGTVADSMCPLKPEPYAGTDAVVAELRALRREAADTCGAVSTRLQTVAASVSDVRAAVEAVDGTVGPLAAKLDVLHDDAERSYAKVTVLPAKLDALHEDLTPADGVRVRCPDCPAYEDSRLVASVDAAGNATHSDLWFIVGLGLALLPAYGLWRVVMPRA